MKPLSKQKILLLQGPIGPFFADLQRGLKQTGIDARHVIFNFADYVYSSRSDVVIYRHAEEKWGPWLAEYLDENDIDLIVLFGCERERHGVARQVAQELSVPVLSLEEAYVRPGFVTAEIGGNNRYSPLKSLPKQSLKSSKKLTFPEAAGEDSSFNKMAWNGFYYYILRFVGLPFFSQAVHHKNRPIVPEAFYWARNAYRKIVRRADNFSNIEYLLEHHRHNYYIVPLQVHDDMQLVKAGLNWTNESLIEKSIESFAKHAPAERLLVIKVHPLDRGHSQARRLVKEISRANGCEHRVYCLDDGSIGLLTRESAGMLTINSSSAFSAMLRRVPLGVLGDAMFRRDDIAWCIENEAELDAFWSQDLSKEISLASKFRSFMRAYSLLPGDYYLAGNRKLATDHIVNMIEAELNKPQESTDGCVLPKAS